MKPGSEDDGSKREAVREEAMEIAIAVVKVTDGMVTTVVEMLECLEEGNSEADRVEIVATVTRVTEGMVTAVEMLEYLGKKDSEVARAAAVHFFSDALAGDEKGALPLHSPGHLPGLLQLLADCVRDMSRAFRDKAILSINRLIYHYARILEPTETEMASLEVAVDALDFYIKKDLREEDTDGHYQESEPFLMSLEVLPTIIGIFQEPRNRKKTQIHAASCLANLAIRGGNTKTHMLLVNNGVMGMMMETVRVGKECPDVLTAALETLYQMIGSGAQIDAGFTQSALDSGILEVLEQVLKRPNAASLQRSINSWEMVLPCLVRLSSQSQEQLFDAILSSGGLMELMLEMDLMEMGVLVAVSEESDNMLELMFKIADAGSESQRRRLMSKESFFRFLASCLKYSYPDSRCGYMYILEACLEVPGTEHELWLRRRLIDDSGITDTVKDISERRYSFLVDDARRIFDTHLKNPLPPRPPSNLPLVIYTKNVPQ